jgi:GNAT superfamily N-acetyltransferase
VLIAIEALADIRDEVWPLLLRNAEETGLPADFDWDRYVILENMGVFQAFTARIAGAIIGYAAFMVTQSMHSRSLRMAVCDTIWVAPEHRRTGAGVRLIRFCEAHYRAAGCGMICIAAKTLNRVGEMLERLGYGESERTYTKELAHG